MSLINWSATLSVNNAAMDQEHRKLIDIINTLHDAMKEGKGKEVVGASLDNLVDYVKQHFSDEEVLLQKHAYPGLASQKAAHAKFTEQVMDFRVRVQEGDKATAIEVMQFLRNWLVGHIQKMDREYGEYLQKKGIV